nr:MAG TPA: hypothetical protein [Caudoviricetes sp.]
MARAGIHAANEGEVHIRIIVHVMRLVNCGATLKNQNCDE